MNLEWRRAAEGDLDLLAAWNHQLIRDEGHRNPMDLTQLRERMRGWLEQDYQAVIFSMNAPVAYALFRATVAEIYLRQLFVVPELRRKGLGRRAVEILRQEIWPAHVRLTVEVLCAHAAGVEFWRAIGYRDYALTLEIMPDGTAPAGLS